jgi:hypothetical protein
MEDHATLTADDRAAVTARLRALRSLRAERRLDELAYRTELGRLLERRREQRPIAFPDRRRH